MAYRDQETEEQFLKEHRETLRSYWDRISQDVAGWRRQYKWRGKTFEEAIAARDSLESQVRDELSAYCALSKAAFDRVLEWGFGAPSTCQEAEIRTATQKAFRHLRQGRLSEAAAALMELPGIGISRASKVLAVSDQARLGIYDSRAAHGLSDLQRGGRQLIAIPPGRRIPGNPLPKTEFAVAFQKYTWVLREFLRLAQEDATLRADFQRVSDVEIAFFARSRTEPIPSPIQTAQAPPELACPLELDEECCLLTLGKGVPFWWRAERDRTIVYTGKHGKTKVALKQPEIDDCLAHFAQRKRFPLGNAVDRPQLGGLGRYFKGVLRKSPKFASHLAALWVHQGLLGYEHEGRAIWLNSEQMPATSRG